MVTPQSAVLAHISDPNVVTCIAACALFVPVNIMRQVAITFGAEVHVVSVLFMLPAAHPQEGQGTAGLVWLTSHPVGSTPVQPCLLQCVFNQRRHNSALAKCQSTAGINFRQHQSTYAHQCWRLCAGPHLERVWRWWRHCPKWQCPSIKS